AGLSLLDRRDLQDLPLRSAGRDMDLAAVEDVETLGARGLHGLGPAVAERSEDRHPAEEEGDEAALPASRKGTDRAHGCELSFEGAAAGAAPMEGSASSASMPSTLRRSFRTVKASNSRSIRRRTRSVCVRRASRTSVSDIWPRSKASRLASRICFA